MNIIQENPYRFIGVYSNSPIKERLSNFNRQKAFLKVGKPVAFQLDLSGILPSVDRTIEKVTDADSKLALPNEQLKYAQFWFVKVTPFDEVAFNHLFAGNIDTAISIWEKKENVSSIQNRIVCALIKKDYATAIIYAQKLYSLYIADFVEVVLGEHSTVSINNIAYDFLDILCAELDVKQILSYISEHSWKEYISSKSVTPLIDTLQSAIDKSKVSKGKGSKARFAAGLELMNGTKNVLKQLQVFITTKDLQYPMIADKLGLEILQCGIDYFNDSDDPDAAHKAMKIQKYALSIVVGKMAKERCRENVNILDEIIKNLPPLEVFAEDKAIKEELKRYCQLPNEIYSAVALLNNTRPHLQSIKAKLGAGNTFYLKLSTQVVGNALHNIIEEVNDAQESERFDIGGRSVEMPIELMSDYQRRAKIDKVKSVLKAAWNATRIMDTFDMETNFKSNRYNENKRVLQGLCNQLGISTSSGTPSVPKPSATRITTVSSTYKPYISPVSKPSVTRIPTTESSADSSDNIPWGCVIPVIICLVIFLMSQCH